MSTWGSGLAGFAKGFGSSFFQARQNKQRREDEKLHQQYNVLASIFEKQAKEGDNEGAATTLEMLDPILTGGKKGKKGEQSPFLALAQQIRQGKQVEKEGSQGQIPETSVELDPGQQTTLSPPGPPESPKVLVKKPFFSDPVEREIETRKRIFEAVEKPALELKYKEQARLSDVKFQQSMAKLDAQQQGQAAKKLKELTMVYGDENIAKEILSQQIEGNINLTQAKVGNIESQIATRQQDLKIKEERLGVYRNYISALENRMENLTRQGDERNQIAAGNLRIRLSTSKALEQQLLGVRQEQAQIVSQQNNLRRIASNALTPENERVNANNQIQELENQYSQREQEYNNLVQKMEQLRNESLSGDLDMPTLQPKSQKTLKPKSNDPRIGKMFLHNGRKVKVVGIDPSGDPIIEPVK